MDFSYNMIFVAPVLGIIALIFAFVLASKISKEEEGTDREPAEENDTRDDDFRERTPHQKA